MPTKRKPKRDTEAAQKAALRQRLHDMLRGACGGNCFTGDNETSEDMWLTANGAEPLSSLLLCIRHVLGYDVNMAELSYFDSLSSVVDFLYQRGVRATSKPKDKP